MYNQFYINTKGESDFEYFLLNGKRLINGKAVDYKLDINNRNMQDIHYYFAFQHYLVKCIKEKKHVKEATKYIDLIYKDFSKAPYLFVNSILLRDNVIDLLFSKENSEIVKGYRNDYFNSKKVIELSRKPNLTEQEKNRYYSILIHNLKNEKAKDFIENEILKIVKSNKTIQSMNDMELQFYSQYLSNWGNKDEEKTVVMIGSENKDKRGYQSAGIIMINKDADTNFPILTKTVLHETRHFTQFKSVYTKKNIEAYEMAAKMLFTKYLNSESYNSYRKNYRYSGIEIDAEEKGYWNAGVFLIDKNKDYYNKLHLEKVENLSRRYFYDYMNDENGKPVPTNVFYIKNFDKIFKNNPEELNKYAVFKQFYDSNGKRKNLKQLFDEELTTGYYNRQISQHFIDYEIHNNGLDNINLNSMNNENVNKFGILLSKKYRDYILTFKDYLNDNPDLKKYETKLKNRILSDPNLSSKDKDEKINSISKDIIDEKKHIEYTTNYKIKQSIIIGNYILKNFDKFIVSYGKKLEVGQDNYFFDFIYDMRDFSTNNIKNEIAKNSPMILQSLKELKIITNEIIKKYNFYFVYGRLKELPEEILNGPAPYNMTFSNYILGLSSKMDGHQYIDHNGKKIYISDIIKSYDPESFSNSQKKAMQ